MKKLLSAFLVIGCLLLVGCDKNIFKSLPIEKETNITPETKNETKVEEKNTKQVLSCNKDTAGTVNFNTEMTYYYENDEPIQLAIKYTYDLSSYTEEKRQSFAAAKLCETDAIKNDLGMIACKEQLSGTNYIVEGYAVKLLEKSKGSLRAMKASFENQALTCTVK